eukprot:TRINITY_DN2616_c0_g6_i1.p1 TRINITY_DN2616_c0_g6~~TRINITY_DN2616_c0_g6_i1.p1  ORF type:complete len:375 (-),score=37.41 TRINITY_DN2616_c0_g6_i1:173-1297(-)
MRRASAMAAETATSRRIRHTAWSSPWSWTQIFTHVATFFAIFIFAMFVQRDWHGWNCAFWVIFCVTLALYAYVCLINTTYRASRRNRGHGSETRVCGDCDAQVSDVRVKHCQSCGKCIAGFDHHCRYLNTCICSANYIPWVCFVVGLLFLMAFCCIESVMAAIAASFFPRVFIILSAAVSCVISVFLICLLLQHAYLCVLGLSTLEWVKSQEAGFPALPQEGWREPVKSGCCYACNDVLVLIECAESDEMWFCTVCQVDVGKARVPFLTCEACEGACVCLVCLRAAREPTFPVVTSRLSSLRRTSRKLGGGEGNVTRMQSSASMSGTQKSRHQRTFNAIFATVEGGIGDAHQGSVDGCCGFCEESASSSSEAES